MMGPVVTLFTLSGPVSRSQEMAERECMDGSGEASVLSIFADLGLQQWLQDMDTERLHNLLRDDNLVGTPTHGTGAVGFSMRRGLAAKLAELRPQDLTEEALGEDWGRAVVQIHTGCRQRPHQPKLHSVSTRCSSYMCHAPASYAARLMCVHSAAPQ